ARAAAAEEGVQIGLGVGLGLLFGLLLADLVVPLVLLTPEAHRPLPAATVQLPAGQLALLVLAMAALPVLLVAWRLLRPGRPSETTARLRHSEEM
ncbi:hypothetical protein, partial [Kitasatospora nipponensis]|uniref:hypothetical protein n=1 Tax=Kitasatospora nipponensis TaxID=258049 RepID=UPI0031D6BC6E